MRLRTDVSYGTYVLAEPAQHALIAAGVLALGVPMLFIATVGLVLAAALVSWRVVERPALALRRSQPLGCRMPNARSRQATGVFFVDTAPLPVSATR